MQRAGRQAPPRRAPGAPNGEQRPPPSPPPPGTWPAPAPLPAGRGDLPQRTGPRLPRRAAANRAPRPPVTGRRVSVAGWPYGLRSNPKPGSILPERISFAHCTGVYCAPGPRHGLVSLLLGIARGRHTAVPALGEPGTETDIKELIINRNRLSSDHRDGYSSEGVGCLSADRRPHEQPDI